MDPLLKKLRHEVESAIADLPASQLSRHLPGKWSTAEILEHLYLTYTGTVKGFERVLAAGKPGATSASWRHRGRQFVVLRLNYFPSGREAPPVARPRGVPAETVLAEIVSKIDTMDLSILHCEEKFGARKKLLDHPILGPLTGAEWRKFHLVHGLHHLKQIRRLREGTTGAA